VSQAESPDPRRSRADAAYRVSVDVPTRPARSYSVHVGEGLLDDLGELCGAVVDAHRHALVADERVAGLYGERALASFRRMGLAADLHAFSPGESSKTRATWSSLTDALLEAGHGRDSLVVALGGGVTGDLAGFVAATYLRGVPVVQVPTTLLAMVDSAVGGKTGVDTSHGKNQVGAFHHPELVVADTSVLETLERRHRAAGLAEAMKTAAVADAALFAWIESVTTELLEARPAPVGELVRRCVEIKGDIVADDPEEAGRRAMLNFGHTVGHALERLGDYRLPHGEAVAAGMRVEARLGEALGITRSGTAEQLCEALEACGHTSRPEAAHGAAELLAAAATDKKGRGGAARFVLLAEVGRVARSPDGGYAHALGEEDLREALASALRGVSDDADCGAGTLPKTSATPTRESAPEA